MILQIILFLTLIAYSMVVAQSFSYIISLSSVQSNMKVETYIEFRKLTDMNFRKKFKYVFYTTLICTTLLCIVAANQPGKWIFWAALIAWLGFITDTVFMMKGNMPVNNAINTWTMEDYPASWQQYRQRWLRAFLGRQIANITGFIALVAAAVFR